LNSLVYERDTAIVTDSLTIADVFQKRHDKVLRDIKSLACSQEFKTLNFGESTYKNKQDRSMPMYIITENGFYILAMGYTGGKAMQFKERYINEFQRMRTILESQKVPQVTLVFKQQIKIKRAVRERIMRLFPSINDTARRKYYSQIYAQLKAKFNISSYRDIRSSDLESALVFIDQWHSPKMVSVAQGIEWRNANAKK
jgi:Rha family phage regulatory protein